MSDFMWLLEGLADAGNDFITGIYDLFFEFILSFYAGEMITNALNMTPVKTAITTVGTIATIFLGLLAIKHIITTYYLEIDGDREMDPLQYLIKVSMATAIIQSAGFITDYMMKLSGLLYEKVIGGQIYEVLTIETAASLESYLTGLATELFSDIYNIIFIVCIIILLVRASIRVAEVVIMRILLPLFACSIVTPSRELWNNFFMSYFVTLFGYIIQIFFLNLSLRIIIAPSDLSSLILSLGCLFFSLKAPKWIEKFVYSTGAGRAGSSAMYMVPQLVRMFKR